MSPAGPITLLGMQPRERATIAAGLLDRVVEVTHVAGARQQGRALAVAELYETSVPCLVLDRGAFELPAIIPLTRIVTIRELTGIELTETVDRLYPPRKDTDR